MARAIGIPSGAAFAVALACALGAPPENPWVGEVPEIASPARVTAEERAKIEAAIPERPRAEPAKPRRLLIFVRNVNYPGHRSIAHACLAFALMGKKTGAFETEVSEDPEAFRPENLRRFDAVFFANTVGNLFRDPGLRESLLEFVRSGGGVLGIHGTSVAFTEWPGATEDWPEFGLLLGARGARHRESDERVYLKLDDPAHPLNAPFGGRGFEYRDEFFRVGDPYSRERVRVLLSIDAEKTDVGPRGPWVPERADGDYAVAWVKSYGEGRVFYSTIGHNPSVFWDPKLLEFYLGAAQFALGDLPAPTTPSALAGEEARAPKALAADEARTREALAAGFLDPPDAAKPWAYWWWLDGNASEEGIARDLEEMRRQGISGVLLFDAGEGKGSPVGPAFLSPRWRELFRRAVVEAARLGLEMGVNLCSGWNAGGTWVTAEHAAKKIVWSEVAVEGPGKFELEIPQPPVAGGHYRDVAVVAVPRREREGRPAIQHLEVKSGRRGIWTNTRNAPWEELPETPGEEDCSRAEVLDLTERLGPEGRLSWDAPPGRWAVIRFGCTLLGSRTKCPSPGSQGLEIDPLSAEAMDFHLRETAEKLLADAGPHLPTTLRWLHIDSYEVGADVGGEQPSWTPRFRKEFRARRGYDLLPYLPVLAGRIVDSRGVSNRFLRDYRRTIGDLFAERHYGRLAEFARAHGLGTHPESGGPFWPHIDALACLGRSDVPMGEFWKRRVEGEPWVWYRDDYPLSDTVKQAATASHVYGKRLSQAEAFTSMGPNWEEAPWDLKDVGDLAFAAGLTRNVLCFSVHQPRLDIVPGYQWEAAGTHFDRNVTWWSRSSAWLRYLARCQFLLGEGRFVADVLYFAGEDVPSFVPGRAFLDPPLPPGRDYDVANAEVLLTRLDARAGRLVLPDGMGYRLLVLPRRRTMSPRVLRKIAELVRAGASVLGARPERAPGLEGYPEADEEVRRLAAELWGEVDGERVRERRVGLGRVVQGRSIEEVLSGLGEPPDFEASGAPEGAVAWIHRSAPAGEIYFVSNQTDRELRLGCTFRSSGRQPELWDAVTGEIRDAGAFRDDGLRTAVPLVLAPRGSTFVVFARPAAAREGRGQSFPDLRAHGEVPGPWIVSFDPKLGGPERAIFERLEDWTKRAEDGIRFYSGAATYRSAFDLPPSLRGRGGPIYLDLGEVRNLAEVRLNGRGLGVVWTAPWRVEISAAARAEGNELEVDVVNLWPNRLIGDAGLPPERRVTETNVKKFTRDSALLPSGLLGPVRLLAPET